MTPRERLTRLAEVLEARPKEDPHFNLRRFGTTNACGTVACAVGWGAFDPVLMKEGLHFDLLNYEFNPPQVTYVSSAEEFKETHREIHESYLGVELKFGNIRNEHATMEFFGLTQWQFNNWFLMNGYGFKEPGPHDVAARIRVEIGR